jgi:hypothetical protein
MKLIMSAGIVLSLACISAAEAPSNYQTYDGVRVDSDPVLLNQYNRVLGYCDAEASMPERGSPDHRSIWHILALRNCLYRHNIVDRGHESYPANAIWDHFFEQ